MHCVINPFYAFFTSTAVPEMMQVRDFLSSPALQLFCCRSNTGDTPVVTNELNYLEGTPIPLQPIS